MMTQDEERVHAIVAEFLDAVDAGAPLDWHALLDQHPDLATPLRAFFAQQEQMIGLAQPIRAFLETHGGAPSRPARWSELRPGTVVGDYVIRGEIGRGGMGIVYEAQQRSLGRRVAMKVLPGLALQDGQAQRFRLEAQAAAQLHHPHIVPVFEVGQADGLQYYVMQRIDGQSLADWLAARRSTSRTDTLGGDAPTEPIARPIEPAVASPLDTGPGFYRAVASIGLAVAEALEHAHRHGIVHRDIKPANLLLDRDGVVWVTDFGLAKTDADGALTQSGDLLGTLRFMPPERFDGWSDPRSDVYGLGLTLYELLTMQPAFAETRQERLIQQILHEDPPRPCRLDRQIPLDLETIVLKAIAKEPAQRYRTAAELAEDLRLFLADLPIKARRITMAGRAWRWCRRNRTVAALLGSVIALLAVIAVHASLNAHWLAEERDNVKKERDNVRTEQRNVETQRQAAVSNLRDAYLAQAQGQRFSGQPGRRFGSLEVLAKAAEIRPGLDLRNEAIACLALPDVRPFRLIRSPAGFDTAQKSIVEADAKGNMILRRVDDEAEICRLPGDGAKCWWTRFSPNDRYLAVRHTGPHKFRVWDVSRREAILDLTLPEGGHNNPSAQQFFADSTRIAIGYPDKTLRVFDLTERKEIRRYDLPYPLDAMAVHPTEPKVAVAGWNVPNVDVLDMETGNVVAKYAQPAGLVHLAWHPHGKILAVCCHDANCHLWNTETGKKHATLVGHKNSVTSAAFNHAGDLLATHGWDKMTRLWDPASGRLLVSIAGYNGEFSPDDRYLAFTTPEERGIWEVSPARECRTFRAFSERGSGASCVDVHPQRQLLASASDDGARLWDLATGRELALLPVGNSRTALFLPGGDLLTHGQHGLQRWPIERDMTDNTYRIGPPKLLAATKGTANYSNACLSRDRRRLAFVATLRQVWVIDPERPDERVVLDGHDGLSFLSISPDGRWVATGTQHGNGIKVWDSRTGTCVKEIEAGHYGSPFFTHDNRTLITWSLGQPARAWETETWRALPTPAKHWDAASHLDDRMMAVSTAQGILLKDLATGAELATLTPSELLPVSRICLSPDGAHLLVSCYNYHTLQVWDLRAVRERLSTMKLDWDHPPLVGRMPTRARVALHIAP